MIISGATDNIEIDQELVESMSRRNQNIDGLGDDERQEQFEAIVELLKENDGEMPYDTLNRTLGERWEGIRLVLKAAKDEGIVDYEGIVPMFDGTIKLAEDTE